MKALKINGHDSLSVDEGWRVGDVSSSGGVAAVPDCFAHAISVEYVTCEHGGSHISLGFPCGNFENIRSFCDDAASISIKEAVENAAYDKIDPEKDLNWWRDYR